MKKPTLAPIPWLATFLVILAFACSDNGSPNEDPPAGRLRVVVTTTQIADFTAQVGGETILLTALLEPNQDAHDFEAEPSDLRALASADLVLRNGLQLDDFVNKAVSQANAPIVVVTDGIPLRPATPGGDVDADADPHVWHSVSNARLMVENIRDALIEADGPNSRQYEENAQTYIGELAALEDEIQAKVASLPQVCRKVISNHDVFGYFADAYGFELIGSLVSSTSSAARASASDVAELVGKIRDSGVPAIFSEASANSGLIRQAAREANVAIVDDLFGDSLGLDSSEGSTYIGMMRWNTARIVEALSPCEA